MNQNILFLLFLLLLGTLQIREGFREGQIHPKVSQKQLNSCKAAKSMWDKRKQNTIFITMATKLGMLCMLPPCGGNQTNDWTCQPPPPKKKSTEKHRKSCDSARAMWNRRIGNKVMESTALIVGKHCMSPPCSGRPSNDWRCQDGPKPKNPPPSKSTKEQRTSCKAARGMWAKRNDMKGAARMMLQTMALRAGGPCMAKGCEGNAQNNWTCQDSPPPPPPPPAKSTAGQRKSCKAAKNLWKQRNLPGALGPAMKAQAMQMGMACRTKPCGGGPANDWKCQDELVKEGMTSLPDCSDKELEEITRLENNLKAAKNRCKNNSAFPPGDEQQGVSGFRGMREGFREGQTAEERAEAAAAARRQWQANQRAAANARAAQAAAARRQQAQLAAAARAAAARQAAAARAETYRRAQLAESNRRSRFRQREIRLDTDAARAPKAAPDQISSCIAAAAACSKSCTQLEAGAIARGVGRRCTEPPCYGGPQNNWKCITSLDNTMNVEGPTGEQQTSCIAARQLFARRNEEDGQMLLARAMRVGTACNACGGNPENNYTCTATRQAAANKARTGGGATPSSGATASSGTAAKAAGAAPARCTKCDASTIVRNLGDQYKNDPNVCKTRKDEAQCADAGGLWNDEKPSNSKKEEGTGDWKVEIDEKSGDLVFNHKGQTKSKLTKTGEWSSDSRKCGTWNIRADRIGIPGRGDIHLHTDGWQRAVTYDAPYNKYNQGGFAGRELWYGGSAGGKMMSGK